MKLLISVALVFTAQVSSSVFAQSNCSGHINGTWKEVSDVGVFVFNSDCSFTYRGADNCVSNGIYSPITADHGSTTAVVTSSTGGNCAPVGSYLCDYTLTSTSATLDCGAGPSSFTKQ